MTRHVGIPLARRGDNSRRPNDRRLQTQHTQKLDFVAPASKIRTGDGRVIVSGAEAAIDEYGVNVEPTF